MPISTQFRMLQTTASLDKILAQSPNDPAQISTNGAGVANFPANDLSGSLAYFARSIQNIHGAKIIGDQVPGLIQMNNNNDIVRRGGHSAAAQKIQLEQHDGSNAQGLLFEMASTATAAASTIYLKNTGGTGAAAIKIETAAAGDINIDSGKDLKVDVAGLHDLNVGGGLDIDVTGATAIDTSTGLSLNAGAASDLTVTAGGLTLSSAGDAASFTVTSDAAGEDLTIQQAGANDSGVAILAAGTGADAIKIDATAGGIDIQSALKIVLDADATGQDAFSVNSAGGIDLLVAQGLAVDAGRLNDAQVKVTPHGTAGNKKVLVKVTGGTDAKAIEIASTGGGVDVSGQAVVLSGSGATGISFRAPVLDSGFGGSAGDGMLFSTYAEPTAFVGKSIFNASTTLIGALNVLADQVSGQTATVFTGSVAATVNANTNVVVGKMVGDNASLLQNVGQEKCQVFLNGQLLRSASNFHSLALTNDYAITAANTLRFQFQLRAGDFINIIDRS